MRANYDYYKAAFEGVEMPFAFVDLDLFDKNIKDIVQRVGDKSIRIATKSLRCTTLIHRILDVSPQFKGLMCLSFLIPSVVIVVNDLFDLRVLNS